MPTGSGADTFSYTVSDGTGRPTPGPSPSTTFNVDAVSNLVTDPDTGFADSTVKWGEQVDIATLVEGPQRCWPSPAST